MACTADEPSLPATSRATSIDAPSATAVPNAVGVTATFAGTAPDEDDSGVAIGDIDISGPVGTADGAQLPTEPIRGDVLRFEVSHCGVFDPAIDFSDAGGFWAFKTVHEIHAGLVRVSDDRPPTAALALAGQHVVSSDGLRHEFALRPGVKFSDGNLVQTSDIVWSCERALRKSTPASEARDVFGRVVGAEAFLAGESDVVAGFQIIDDRRLVVELTTADADFLLRLTRPAAYVLSESDARGWDGFHPRYVNAEEYPGQVLADHRRTYSLTERQMQPPVGAGPCRLVEYADPLDTLGTRNEEPTGDRCVIVPNEHYWEPDVPNVDAVIADVVDTLLDQPTESVTRQVGRIASDELDLAFGRVMSEFDEGRRAKRLQVVDASRRSYLRFWSLNPSVPPLDHVEVRRALVRVAGEAVDAGSDARVAPRLFPEGFFSADDAALTAARPAFGDWEDSAARKLLGAELGYYSLFPEIDNVHDRVFAAWSDRFETEVMHYQATERELFPEVPLSDVAVVETLVSTRTPLLGEVLRSASHAFGGDDPPPELAEFRSALADAVSELDNVRRRARFLALERQLLDQALVLPLHSPQSLDEVVVQPWVHGIAAAPFGGSIFADVWFSEEAPRREVPLATP